MGFLLCSIAPLHAQQAPQPSLKSFRTFAPPPDVWPVAPNKDPRDFEGVYALNPIDQHLTPVDGGITTSDGQVIPPFNEMAAALFWKRVKAQNDGEPLPDASILCEPSWKTRTSSQIRVMQSAEVIVFFMAEHHIARFIYMNARHPKSLKPSYMGHSVGRWDGNTLVIDTVGFNDRGWWDFAGTPQSSRLHLVERITKQADGTLEDLMSFSDPGTYTHEFKSRDLYRWGPADQAIDEQICEESDNEWKILGARGDK